MNEIFRAKCECGKFFSFKENEILPSEVVCGCGKNVNIDGLKKYYPINNSIIELESIDTHIVELNEIIDDLVKNKNKIQNIFITYDTYNKESDNQTYVLFAGNINAVYGLAHKAINWIKQNYF